MILIAHRGSIDGPIKERENTLSYIEEAHDAGYDVEIDIRLENNKLYLGHDKAQEEVQLSWLKKRTNWLWVHCKTPETFSFFYNSQELFIHYQLNYFLHDVDQLALTSKNYIWAYPGMQPLENSIAVLPELHNEDVSKCIGVCSDYLLKYV